MREGIRLYPDTAPGSEKLVCIEEHFTEENNGKVKELVRGVTVPELIPYIPDVQGLMPAVIVIPGGAFKRQVLNQEGSDIAEWLNSQGIAAYVLKTRLPVDEHKNRYDVLLMDIQRAVRTVRANCEQWNIREDAIGVMGFSAGGYQAALGATGYNIKLKGVGDEVDSLSARPDFCVLGYPAISLDVQKNRDEGQQVKRPVAEYEIKQLKKYEPHEMLGEDAPPLFIMDTDDDMTTPAENSILMYFAARRNGVSAELHVFKKGGHGYALGDDSGLTGQWKELFKKWFKETVK